MVSKSSLFANTPKGTLTILAFSFPLPNAKVAMFSSFNVLPKNLIALEPVAITVPDTVPSSLPLASNFLGFIPFALK